MKFIALLLGLFFVQNDSIQYEMFVKAIENKSTSPNYVLVTVTNLNDNNTKEICTEAPFLEGAIHKEKDIDYDSESLKQVKDYLVNQKDLHFSLNNREALKNIGFFEYDGNELSRIKRNYDLDSIIDSVYENEKYVFSFQGNRKEQIYFSHLLLSNNIMVRRGCVTGNLLSLELFEE